MGRSAMCLWVLPVPYFYPKLGDTAGADSATHMLNRPLVIMPPATMLNAAGMSTFETRSPCTRRIEKSVQKAL